MEKNIFTKTLAVAALFFAVSAKAGDNYVKYSCNNIESSKLNVFHSFDDVQSKKAVVHLTVNGELKVYDAIYEPLPKAIFVTEGYEYQLLEGENKIGSLKVKTQQLVGRGGGNCGRAGCDFQPPSKLIPVFTTYAAIQIGDYEDSFDCHN